MARCKPCDNPYDIPRHLPAGLTQNVLHAFATKSPPYHVTTDDVATPSILIGVAKTTGHQCVRGRGGTIAVLCETHWDGLLRPTWERELDLQAFRHHILSYWATEPAQHQPNTRQYQQRRITQPHARSPAQKANTTSQAQTDYSRTMFTVPASYPPPHLLKPLYGTTPLTVPGG